MGAGDGFRGEAFTGAGSPKGGSVTGTVSAYAFFYPLTRDYIRGAVCKTAGIMLSYIKNNVSSDLISSNPQGEQGK